MNNNTTNEDLYRLIVNENQHRLNVFKYFNDPFPDDKYYLIDSVMSDYANKLLKRLSFSTNFIRRFILNDNITAACYKLSKLRIDYYNGNLSRIDMVNKRNELEQFLTNKRAKIIKDWNSNIWLVMIMDNIDCSFDNNYGMGIVTFNANWLEVGDPTNQEDLQVTGLVDVGGV